MRTLTTTRKKILFCFFCIVAFLGQVSTLNAQSVVSDVSDAVKSKPLTTNEIKELLREPVPRIKIPGLDFSEPVISEEDGGKYVAIPFLGEYIQAIYQYAIIFISIFATVVLIIAGIRWTLGGSRSDTREKILKSIRGAIIGLSLSAGSYVVLYSLNPSLVEFKHLRVPFVQPLAMEQLISVTAKGSGAVIDFDGNISQASSLMRYDGPNVAMSGSNCKHEPSKPSGIGTETLLGSLDCHARTKRKSLSEIKYVILHEGGRTAARTVKWWEKLCRQSGTCLGTHYFIDRNGTIHQITDEIKRASHTPGGWNDASIGIDLAIKGASATLNTKTCIRASRTGKYTKKGKTKSFTKEPTASGAHSKCVQEYTTAQYNSLRKLLKSIASRTSVTLDAQSIRTHCNTSENHADPRGFDWNKLGLGFTGKSSNKCHFSPEHRQEMLSYATEVYKEETVCCQLFENIPPIPVFSGDCSNVLPKAQCGLE